MLNKITVIGNLGTDPEMRYTSAGVPVTSFRLAVTRTYNSQAGERMQETEEFTVVVWRDLAEHVNQYLSKGRRAYVDGRLHSDTYQGNDGQMRFRNEIIADSVLFLDRVGPGSEDADANFGGSDYSPGGAPSPDDQMVGLNKIMVIGNLGTDPEMRYTPSGTPVTSFRLAASRTYNSQDGERMQETEWFTVVAWQKLAEQVNQYLSKGRRTYVDGRLHSYTYQGNDGQMRSRNEITANRVLFLDRAGSGSEDAATGANVGGSDYSPGGAPSPDDLPF